jgi:virginiamycin B lyase
LRFSFGEPSLDKIRVYNLKTLIMTYLMLGISLLISTLIAISLIIIAIDPGQQHNAYAQTSQNTSSMQKEFPVTPGSHPHDVAPTKNGETVWYTAQASGKVGRLDSSTGKIHEIALGQGSAPHGVIIGPDGAPWITDGGLNAILRVDPVSEKVQVFQLPRNSGYANLNTATFDHHGILWFTGQSGIYGRLDTSSWKIQVFKAPRGPGPYGITTTPNGDVYYASLAGSYIGHINITTGDVTVLDPPTQDQGARRIWSDTHKRLWISEWNAGKLALYDPATDKWQEWRIPGSNPMPYAIYVDDHDIVWLSDFGANALVKFDPTKQEFEVFPLSTPNANIRQILGRPGEIWGAESGLDRLTVLRTGNWEKQ